MVKNRPYEVRLAKAAIDDIGDILDWTIQKFGSAMATRYKILIDQAISDLEENPQRIGAKHPSDLLTNLWLYHLSFSRTHVSKDQIVKSPRHFIMFKHLQPGVIEIIRILHDSRDLTKHLPGTSKSH